MQDTPAPNKRMVLIDISVDTELMTAAEQAAIDVATVLDRALREAMTSQQRFNSWREENRLAIEASNAELERNGMWFSPDWLTR